MGGLVGLGGAGWVGRGGPLVAGRDCAVQGAGMPTGSNVLAPSHQQHWSAAASPNQLGVSPGREAQTHTWRGGMGSRLLWIRVCTVLHSLLGCITIVAVLSAVSFHAAE